MGLRLVSLLDLRTKRSLSSASRGGPLPALSPSFRIPIFLCLSAHAPCAQAQLVVLL